MSFWGIVFPPAPKCFAVQPIRLQHSPAAYTRHRAYVELRAKIETPPTIGRGIMLVLKPRGWGMKLRENQGCQRGVCLCSCLFSCLCVWVCSCKAFRFLLAFPVILAPTLKWQYTVYVNVPILTCSNNNFVLMYNNKIHNFLQLTILLTNNAHLCKLIWAQICTFLFKNELRRSCQSCFWVWVKRCNFIQAQAQHS